LFVHYNFNKNSIAKPTMHIKPTHTPDLQEIKDTLIDLKNNTYSKYEPFDRRDLYDLNKLIHPSMFITEFIISEDIFDFVQKIGIERVLGYSDKEFTIQNLIKLGNLDAGSDDIYIIHPEDLEHTLRYSKIIFQLLFSHQSMSNDYSFKAMRDYYSMTFRVRKKNGEWVRLTRMCYLYRLDENGKPLSHLDFWIVLGMSDKSNHVNYHLSYNNSKNEHLEELFYEMNCQLLDIKFDMAEREVLKLFDEGFTRKQMALIINNRLNVSSEYREIFKGRHKISANTIKHYYDSMRNKAFTFLEKRDEKLFSGSTQLLNFAKKFGLY